MYHMHARMSWSITIRYIMFSRRVGSLCLVDLYSSALVAEVGSPASYAVEVFQVKLRVEEARTLLDLFVRGRVAGQGKSGVL